MVSRAYGRSMSAEEIEDAYAAAWTATLSALRTRGEEMSDEELRAYVLTAVASHASKELRRRARRPAGSLESAHEQVISDVHAPLPEEAAIGSETAGVARDLLTSLPARRRAVMLLRYGWGLSPKEVCSLVSGLSARAYRKEVTKGVEQLIERLKQVETGEWCESREPLLRDYVAGTAAEDERRQVEHHLSHCRACSTFASRLAGHLHDFGAGVALASAASVIGGPKLGVLERLGGLLDTGRIATSSAIERGEAAVTTVAASGGARGSGAAGAGLLAKVAAGGAGKVALACLGTGAAATACVAAGIVPGVSLTGSEGVNPTRDSARRIEQPPDRGFKVDPRPATTSVVNVGESVASSEEVTSVPEELTHGTAPQQVEDPEPEAAVPDPAVQEFDPVAAAAAAPAAPAAPAASGSADSSTGSPAGGGGSSAAGDEFGP